jgi:hypothetical protein
MAKEVAVNFVAGVKGPGGETSVKILWLDNEWDGALQQDIYREAIAQTVFYGVLIPNWKRSDPIRAYPLSSIACFTHASSAGDPNDRPGG